MIFSKGIVSEYFEFNPKETLSKNQKYKKIAMENIVPKYKFINKYSFEKYKGGSKFKNGDTIFARITPCLENGKIAYVDCLEDDEIAFGSTEFIVLRAIESKMIPEFVYYFAISDYFKNKAISLMTGTSGRQRVQVGALKQLNVKIPDIISQKKIVKILSIIDKKIKLNNEINNNLYEIIKNNYDTLLENCNWEEVELGSISNISSGKRPIDKLEISDYPVIGANGVMAYTSDFNFNEDLIITGRVGTLGIIRRYYEKIWASDNTLVIQTKYLNYIENYLKTIDYYSLNRGSTQPLLTQGDLKNQTIRFNEKEISGFEDKNRVFVDKIRNNEKENKHLSQLRYTLLPKLMNGEIDLDNIEI